MSFQIGEQVQVVKVPRPRLRHIIGKTMVVQHITPDGMLCGVIEHKPLWLKPDEVTSVPFAVKIMK